MATLNFMGRSGFNWFFGVVEDRNDPEYLGRLRVRCIGYHTENKTELPTEDLPWATVMTSITSASISGIGQSATGVLPGSWVFGFFKDKDCQEPMILGTMPGRPVAFSDSKLGFNDPNGKYPTLIFEPDTNRMAINEKYNGTEVLPNPILEIRRATRITDVAAASMPTFTTANGNTIDEVAVATWDQPVDAYNTVYPYNKVNETESGHLIEMDDTPNAERIHVRHRTGTSYEFAANGDRIDIIKNKNYSLTASDSNTLIEGSSNVTIDGHSKVYINKSGTTNNHYTIQVGSGANVNVVCDSGDINLFTNNGNINLNANGDLTQRVTGNYTLKVLGNVIETVEGSISTTSIGANVIRASTIDLN